MKSIPDDMLIFGMHRGKDRMDKESIFKAIQKYMQSVPLVLIGTGGTIPHGLPSMAELAEYLIVQLNDLYKTDAHWHIFKERLTVGIDLENALADLNLSDDIIHDITKYTWKLVSEKDLNLLRKIINNEVVIPLGKLLKYMFVAHPQCINIITTNYDRVIEYACDQFSIKASTLCTGNYIKQIDIDSIKYKDIVNILKVHGSLDWFENKENIIYSIPLQNTIPDNMIPKIIPPGSLKYRSVLQLPCRNVLHKADDLISKANGFLCIGYGFNDEQIQTNIISGVKRGKPIIIITKKLSKSVLSMLNNNVEKYVAIQESDTDGFTDFFINNECVSIYGTYWTVDGFINIVLDDCEI
jgi:hypothetical protein